MASLNVFSFIAYCSMVMVPSVCWDRDGVTASGEKPAIAATAPTRLMADLRVSPSREPIVKLFECATISPFPLRFRLQQCRA
jgi:hypothetical protein